MNQNGDYSNLTSFIMTMGNMAQQKRNPKISPGGVGQMRPSPSKMRQGDGVSDSDFVGQILRAAQGAGMSGQSLLTPGNAGMMGGQGMPQQPMQQGPQAPQQPGQGGGLLSLLGGGQ